MDKNGSGGAGMKREENNNRIKEQQRSYSSDT
jgi:hypothetical protein